jgi:hypothetical protein
MRGTDRYRVFATYSITLSSLSGDSVIVVTPTSLAFRNPASLMSIDRFGMEREERKRNGKATFIGTKI